MKRTERSFVELQMSPTLLRRIANMIGGSDGEAWGEDRSRDAQVAVASLRLVYAGVYQLLEGISKGRGANLLTDLRDLEIQLAPDTGRSSLVMDTGRAMYALSKLASKDHEEPPSDALHS